MRTFGFKCGKMLLLFSAQTAFKTAVRYQRVINNSYSQGYNFNWALTSWTFSVAAESAAHANPQTDSSQCTYRLTDPYRSASFYKQTPTPQNSTLIPTRRSQDREKGIKILWR